MTNKVEYITFTVQIYNALHMQGKRATFVILGAWPFCSP